MNRHDPLNIGEISNLYSWIAARATRCATERLSDDIGRGRQSGCAALERMPEIGLEIREGRLEQLVPRDHYHVHPELRGFRTTEDLSNQSFSSVSSDRVAELPGGHDAQPCSPRVVGSRQHRQISSFRSERQVEHALEFAPAPDPAVFREALGRHRQSLRGRRAPAAGYEEETVRRFRPFARRRFRTWRPFLVAMRTRKPCVRLRRRRFGWNVTLIVGSPATERERRRNLDSNQPDRSLSIASPGRFGGCRRWNRVLQSASPADPVGAPPEVFHNCGKKCGKAKG
jgi:hypothetical protein